MERVKKCIIGVVFALGYTAISFFPTGVEDMSFTSGVQQQSDDHLPELN
jgi:hypothetical protein